MEIRFRVWDGEKMWYPEEISTKRPIYGLEEWYLGISGRLCSVSHSYDGAEVDYFPRHPIMLSTGLKDKDGKEIWEGDIIQCNNQLSGYYHRFPITLADGRFKPITDANETGDLEWLNIEILGTIYENPEQLTSSSTSCNGGSSAKAVKA